MSAGRWAGVGAVGLVAALLVWLTLSGSASPAATSTAVPASGLVAASSDPTSAELVEHPKKWDGTRISFTGEAVGSVMVRGDGAWVHLNDDPYSRASVEDGGTLAGYNSGQAVWVSAQLASVITVVGDYKHQGDIVRVEGIFHAADSQHGGDMDIHADTLTIVRPGFVIHHPLQASKVLWFVILAPVAAGLWLTERRLSARQR